MLDVKMVAGHREYFVRTIDSGRLMGDLIGDDSIGAIGTVGAIGVEVDPADDLLRSACNAARSQV